MKTTTLTLSLGLLLAITPGCDSSINKSIYVQDGERRDSGINTVNGTITIGNDCVIRGDCRTVNGAIRVGQNSIVRELQVVNGEIELGRKSRSKNDLMTVNGTVTLQPGSLVNGDVSTINGGIRMDNATVEQDLTLFNGNIELVNASLVKGDIIIKDSKGNRDRNQVYTIRLGEGSVVEGDIFVQEDEVKVKVVLGKDASVKGNVTNAEVIREL